jgi:hypothetical protein
MATTKPEAVDLDLQQAAKVVRVALPREVAYDLDRFQSVQKDILGKLGCLACCSGYDIRWEFEQRFLVDAKLNVRAI